MLTVLNAEGCKVQANLDNYVVVSAFNYCDTDHSELDSFLKLVRSFHSEVVLFECCDFGRDALMFFQNIDEVIIISERELGGKYYLQVRRA